jgi:AcrR family transcriptional regulator
MASDDGDPGERPPAVSGGGRVERRRAAARDEFLAAALEVVEAHGLREFSLERVGRRVGVRKQALYHYFDSKEAVLFEVALAQHAAVAHAVARAVAPTGDAADAVEAMVRAFFGAYHGRLRLFQLCHTLLPMFDVARLADAERMGRLHRLNDLLLGGVAARVARDRGADPAQARRFAFVAYTSTIGLLAMMALAESAGDPLRHDADALLATLVATHRTAASGRPSP